MNSTFQRLIFEATRLAQGAKAQVLASVRPSADRGDVNPLHRLAAGASNPMNSPAFQNSMAEATRLMQSGDLQAATAAIQAALGGDAMPAGAANDANVIDVEAHEVGRPVPAPTQKPSDPTVRPGPTGQFISGGHTEGTAGTREYKLFIPPASFAEPLPLVVMLHGCTVKEGSLIGIKAVVLNGAVIGRECLIGANSLIPEGKVIADRSLVMGSPGRVVRQLSDEEVARIRWIARHYVDNAARYLKDLAQIG